MSAVAVALVLGVFCAVVVLLHWLIGSGLAQIIALDQPNKRSLHKAPVPRVGGLVLVSIGAGVLWVAVPSLWPMAAIAVALMLLSAWDDRHGLPVALRMVAHLVAALLAAWLLLPAAPAWLWFAVMLVLAWAMNLYNFMDGSDGIAGGMAVIGFGALALAAAGVAPDLAVASACIAAAAAGFLVYNFHPARVFLGDAGSIPLGFLGAAMGLAGWVQGSWPAWFPLLVFSPFVVDATVTLALRVARGHRPWQAHREHAYQRMVAGGLGHRSTALIWYVLMGCCALSAVLSLRLETSLQQVVFGSWVVIYFVLLVFVYKRFPRRRV